MTLDHPCKQTCSGWKQGYERAVSDVLAIVDEWHRSYPEDIFTPLPKYGTPEAEAQDNTLVTRASAHMGRHMCTKLKEEIFGLIGNKP